MVSNKQIKEYLIITIGIIIVTFSMEYFFVPNKLGAGGMVGAAIIINSVFPSVSVAFLNLVLNIILLIISFFVLGGEFGVKTVYASVGLSVLMWITEKFLNPVAITSDLILAAMFGTIISAFGTAIIFNNKSSTGGSDIIAMILNKFFNIKIGNALLIVDVVITIGAVFFISTEIGLYSMLSVIILGTTIDYLIDGFNTCKEVLIMSDKVDEISSFIINDIERGCTFLNGIGAFTNNEVRVIYAVLERNEYIKLKRYIIEIDKSAFISVRDSHEVLGQGFNEIM